MAVPYTFAGATSSIPLSQLDANFATTITLGNTAIQLGNTVSTLNNMTLANVTISSVSTPITAAQGGTGLVTITSNAVMLGNGTGSITTVSPGANGNVLTSNGTTWTSAAPTGVSQWTTSGSDIYYNTGNVGIGTSSPSQELEVKKDQASGTIIKVTNKTNNSSATAGVLFENSTSNTANLTLWDSGTIAGTVYSDAYGFYLTQNGGPLGIVNENVNGVIKFATGGTTERMRLDSSGNLGIGVTPSFKLDISGSGTTAKINTLDTHDGGASLSTWLKVGRRAGTGTNAYINTLHSGSDAVSALTWAFGTSGTGTETLRLASADGTVILKGGSTSATGTGITFPATQSASTDANTLDDYEQGTWTPSLGGNTTYNSQNGTYTKVGRQVTVRGQVNVNAIGTGSTTLISGLPFTASGNFHGTGYWGLAANNLVFMVLQTVSSDTTIQIYDATAATATLGTTAVFANSTNVTFTLTYFV